VDDDEVQRCILYYLKANRIIIFTSGMVKKLLLRGWGVRINISSIVLKRVLFEICVRHCFLATNDSIEHYAFTLFSSSK